MAPRTYTDDQLTRAVAGARSWRAVLRELGLSATSAAASRSVRRRAEALGLDHAHFTGQRRWTEAGLAAAVAGSRTWTEVAERLGLSGGSTTAHLRGHAVRLGIDTGHLGRRTAPRLDASPTLDPDLGRLRLAGSMMAATCLTLGGYEVSWPLEPCRYDLLAVRGGRCLKVQVKTTRYRQDGQWLVDLSSGRAARRHYDPDEVDAFFVIDGDLDFYLIPFAAVGGRHSLTLSHYVTYRVCRTTMTWAISDGRGDPDAVLDGPGRAGSAEVP